jgi:mannose-1-phosphate guanylyltransferase
MQAIILAGGFGTRLRPLTYTRAKPLLPILNKPMISYIINALPDYVDEVILAANYLKNQLQEYFDRNNFNKKIIINDEPKPLGTGGAVKNAEKYIEGTFLVLNSDIISSLNIDKMIEFHKKRNATATISLWPVENVSEFGVVKIEKNKEIKYFIEKPKPEEAPSNLINAGVYVLEQDILDYIETKRLVSMEKEIFPQIIKDKKTFLGFEFEGYWIDVGRISSYIKANLLMLKEENKKFTIGKNTVNNGIINFSSLGNNVFVGYNAKVESSVIYDNVKIGKDTMIKNSVIGENVTIEEGAKIVDSVVGDNEKISSDALIKSQRVWTQPIPKGYPERQVGNIIES